MIVEILVAQRQGEDALPDQLAHRVLDQLRVAMVDELLGQSLDDPGFASTSLSSITPPSE